jgi:hypothetical protein
MLATFQGYEECWDMANAHDGKLGAFLLRHEPFSREVASIRAAVAVAETILSDWYHGDCIHVRLRVFDDDGTVVHWQALGCPLNGNDEIRDVA